MKLRALFLATCLPLTACLTVESIPIHEPDGGDTKRDAFTDMEEPSDPVRPQPDGGVADTGTEEPPAAPTCREGTLERCKYKLENPLGRVIAINQAGDYVYWLEAGSTDSLNNPRYNGVIARTKLGEWKREVLLSGLDFYNETVRAVAQGARIRASERFVVWTVWVENASTTWFLDLSEESPRARELGQNLNVQSCVFGGTTIICNQLARRLDVDEPFRQFSYEWLYGTVHENKLYSATSQTNQPLQVYEFPALTLSRTLQPAAILHAVLPGDLMVGSLADGYIGTAQIDASSDRLNWTAITKGTYLTTRGDWIYLMASSSNLASWSYVDTKWTVTRHRLHGTESQTLAVFDHLQWLLTNSTVLPCNNATALDTAHDMGSLGMVFTPSTFNCNNHIVADYFEFVPFPAD